MAIIAIADNGVRTLPVNGLGLMLKMLRLLAADGTLTLFKND